MQIKLKGNSKLNFSAINAKDIIVEGIKTPDIKIYTEEINLQKTILSLNFNNQHVIKLGDIIEVEIFDRKYKYNVEYIQQLTNTKFILSTDLINKSSVFLSPIIFNTKQSMDWSEYKDSIYCGMNSGMFINTYIDKNSEYIYCKYLSLDTDNFRELEQKITANSLFIDFIDKGQYVIYKFKIPDNYQNDVSLFLEGQYSQLSNNLKKKIINFHYPKFKITLDKLIDTTEYPTLVGVLYKHPVLRKQMEDSLGCDIEGELHSKCKLIDELYDNKN